MTSKTRHILGLSGGKDSTALAIYMRDKIENMEYFFCDTDKELKDTYEYLNRVEAFLGKKIIRLNAKAGFDHWLEVFGGYLPGPNMRWCTKMLKLKPLEDFVGDDDVISYVGIRSDENRSGYVSTKPNIKAVFPLKEGGVDLQGVMRILENSGIGMPPYLQWGRTHSGCYFCFFQRQIEWVRLLENFPDLYDQAQAYEKFDAATGKEFTWNQKMSLKELRKPDNVQFIKDRFEESEKRVKAKKSNGRLVNTLAGLDEDTEIDKPCMICHK